MAKAQNPAPIVLPIADRLNEEQYAKCRSFNIPFVEALSTFEDFKNCVPKFMEGKSERETTLQEVWDIIHPAS